MEQKYVLSHAVAIIRNLEKTSLFVCLNNQGQTKESAIFVQKAQAMHYTVQVHLEERAKRTYAKRGRPTKDTPCKETISYYVSHTVSERDPMMNDYDLFKESTFVLITSLLDEVKYPDSFILEEYKGQNSIEQAFRFLKSPVYLGPVYLKKPERVEALGVDKFSISIIFSGKLRDIFSGQRPTTKYDSLIYGHGVETLPWIEEKDPWQKDLYNLTCKIVRKLLS